MEHMNLNTVVHEMDFPQGSPVHAVSSLLFFHLFPLRKKNTRNMLCPTVPLIWNRESTAGCFPIVCSGLCLDIAFLGHFPEALPQAASLAVEFSKLSIRAMSPEAQQPIAWPPHAVSCDRAALSSNKPGSCVDWLLAEITSVQRTSVKNSEQAFQCSAMQANKL